MQLLDCVLLNGAQSAERIMAMYASIRRYVVHPGSIDEIARQVNKGFLPIIRDIPGFVVYYVVDAGTV